MTVTTQPTDISAQQRVHCRGVLGVERSKAQKLLEEDDLYILYTDRKVEGSNPALSKNVMAKDFTASKFANIVWTEGGNTSGYLWISISTSKVEKIEKIYSPSTTTV